MSPSTSLENAESGLSRYTVIALWSVIAVFAVITLARSVAVDVPIRDPGGKIVLERLGIAVEWLLALVLADALGADLWRHRSLRALPRVLRERWPWRRVWPVGMAVIAYHLVYVCYRNLKSWDALQHGPRRLPAGPGEVAVPRAQPRPVLHHDVREETAAYVLVDVYNPSRSSSRCRWWPRWCSWTGSADGYVFLTSAMWVWILGVGSYYLIPSLGPFASAPEDFTGLATPRSPPRSPVPRRSANTCSASPAPRDAFASISAFASLHVAFTCMVLLMPRYYGQLILARALAVYLAAAMVSPSISACTSWSTTSPGC